MTPPNFHDTPNHAPWRDSTATRTDSLDRASARDCTPDKDEMRQRACYASAHAISPAFACARPDSAPDRFSTSCPRLRVEIASAAMFSTGKQFGDAGSYERITDACTSRCPSPTRNTSRIVDLGNAVNLKNGGRILVRLVAVRPKDAH